MSSTAFRQARHQDGGKCQASAASAIPGAGPWTSDEVERRLRAAMKVMARLRDGTRRLLRAVGGESWPDSHVKESPENKPLPLRLGRLRPGGAELDKADEAIGWLLWLDGRTRLIVSGRVAGASWRDIGLEVALGRHRARLIYTHGLFEIARRLNATENNSKSY